LRIAIVVGHWPVSDGRCRGAMGVLLQVGAIGAVVISALARQRCCSQSSFRYLSLWQRSEAEDVARPPRRVAKIGGFH
jgi:hypothetical protein